MSSKQKPGKPEHIANRLRAKMVAGEYPPGGFLPGERQLAAALGVARNTLRAALGLLEKEKRIDRRKGRGALVREQSGNGVNGLVALVIDQPISEGGFLIRLEGMALLGGAIAACAGSNIRFLMQSLPDKGVSELVKQVQGGAVAGLLFLECEDAGVLKKMRELNIPHVVINQEFNFPGPATRVDAWTVGRQAADKFIALGHRRLGVLAGPKEVHLYNRMLAGFRGRAAEAELYLDARNVMPVPSCSESARKAALAMLRGCNRPTAIFCCRDIRAYGAYLAARELGLRVPEDLSLIGYDDISWPGEGRALLTTFHEPTQELGAAAIAMLTSYIKTGKPPEDVILCPKLIERRSAARPSQNKQPKLEQ